jgi:hypothetical protein
MDLGFALAIGQEAGCFVVTSDGGVVTAQVGKKQVAALLVERTAKGTVAGE